MTQSFMSNKSVCLRSEKHLITSWRANLVLRPTTRLPGWTLGRRCQCLWGLNHQTAFEFDLSELLISQNSADNR